MYKYAHTVCLLLVRAAQTVALKLYVLLHVGLTAQSPSSLFLCEEAAERFNDLNWIKKSIKENI